jgi:carbonic anhydrase
MYFSLLCLSVAEAWTYSDQSSWDAACTSSSSSPQKIVPSSASPVPGEYKMKIVFMGSTGSKTIVNTGNLIRITSNLGYIEVGDMNSGRRIFNVDHIDFHTHSEHYIGGTFFPIEMEIVCTIMDRYWERDQPNLAIVSVIIQKGDESYFFNTLEIMKWPKVAGKNYTTASTSAINLRDLVTNTEDYYFYIGTATTPDLSCQSDVLWYIIQDVKQASGTQVDYLSSLFSVNTSKTLQDSQPTLYASSSLFLLFSLISLLVF